jgi:hypothetical protein
MIHNYEHDHDNDVNNIDNENQVVVDEIIPVIIPIEFDNVLQMELERQFYASVPRDHCANPERCPECSSPTHFNTIKDAYTRLIYDNTTESTPHSIKIQIILFVICIINQYHYFFKYFPNLISVIVDRINEIESKKTRITNTWYIDYMNDIINEFYDIFIDQLMNR